jgi:hypothetical protein
MPYVGSLIKKGNLPGVTAYEDEANLFTQPQKIQNTAQTLLSLYRLDNVNTRGTGIDVNLRNLASAEITYAQFYGEIEDSTTSSEKGRATIYVRHTGALRRVVRFNNDGSIEWGLPSNPLGKFDPSNLTAAHTWQFPNTDGLLASAVAANLYTQPQTFDNYFDVKKVAQPANPGANYLRFFGKTVDANNDSIFTLAKRGGSIVAIDVLAGLGGSGEINTASNVGTSGVGFFKQKSVFDLQFKKITVGSYLTVTDNTGNSTVDLALSSLVAKTDVSNIYSAAQKFDLGVKVKPTTAPTTDGAYGQYFVDSADNKPKYKFPDGTIYDLTSTGAGGETNTMSNVGTQGVGPFDAKVGVNFNMRNVAPASSDVTVANNSTNKTIDIGLASNVAKLASAQTWTGIQRYNAAIKIAPTTVPVDDAAVGQLYFDSADGNKPKAKRPSGAIDDLTTGTGGSSLTQSNASFIVYRVASTYYQVDPINQTVDSDPSFLTILNQCLTALAGSRGKILLGSGDFSLTALLTVNQDNIEIEGAGVDITRIILDTPTSPNATSIRVGTTSLGTAHTLTANATKGQRVITGSSTGITAGDWIFLTAADIYVDASSTTRLDAEFHKVLSVDSGTQITVEDNLQNDYNTASSAEYYKVPWVKGFSLRNLTIYDNRGDNNVATAGDGPFHMVFGYTPRLENVKLEKMAHDSVRVESCFEPVLTNVYCETPVSVADDPDHEYGVYVTGCTTNFQWNGGWGNRCRHTITNNTNSGALYRRGRQRNGTVNGVTSFNANVAHFDLHQAGLGWTFNGCVALGGQHETASTDVQGFNLRSPATLNGCVVQGITHESIVVWIDSDVAGSDFTPGGSRTSIIGCQIISPLKDDADTVRRGIIISAYRGSVSIIGTQFYDINQESILFEGNNKNITVSGCVFHSCGANLASSNGLIKAATGAQVDKLIVTQNQFDAGTPAPSGHPLYLTMPINGLIFKDNIVLGLTNKDPVVPSGSTNTIIKDNAGGSNSTSNTYLTPQEFDDYLLLKEISSPTGNPATGFQRMWMDSSTHHLMRKDSIGTITDVEAGSIVGGGGGSPFVYDDFTSGTYDITVDGNLSPNNSWKLRYHGQFPNSGNIYDVGNPGDNGTTLVSGAVVRYGIQVNGSAGILVGATIDKWTVRLKKTGTPDANISAVVRNSADSVVATFTETPAGSSLTTSYANVVFNLASPYTLQAGDRLLIQYSGANGVIIELFTTDQFDTSNTRRTSYNAGTGLYTESSTTDICGQIHVVDTGKVGVRVPASPTNGYARVFYEYPYRNKLAYDYTAASLVYLNHAPFSDVEFELYVRTVKQLRVTPNSWDTVWLMFRFNEAQGTDFHHYYLALKSNGTLELGKKDNAVMAEEQYYMSTGVGYTYALNTWNKVKIRVVGFNIKVYIDDVLKIDFTDDGHLGAQIDAPNTPASPSIYLANGLICLYNEDAEVEFGPMTITDLTTSGGGGGGTVQSASNIGVTGIGTFEALSGTDLQFRRLYPLTSRISIAYDATNKKIDFDVPYQPGSNLTYIIYKSGSNYYAVYPFNGTVISGPSASFYTVLTACMSALGSAPGKIGIGSGDFSLTTQFAPTNSNVQIEGCGYDITRILYDMSGTGAGINWAGAVGTYVNLSSNAAKGSRTLNLTSTGFAVNDWIHLRRNVNMQSGQSTAYDAEIHRIASIPDGTHITLDHGIYAAYNTADTAQAAKITFRNSIQLKNLTIYDNRASVSAVSEQGDTVFHLCKNLLLENVKFENCVFSSLTLKNVLEAELYNLIYESPRSTTGLTTVYTGLHVAGASTDITIEGGTGNECSSTLDFDMITGTGASSGRPRNIKVTGVRSYNADVAHFYAHEGVVGLEMVNCGAVGGFPQGGAGNEVEGFSMRSPALLIGCFTNGTYYYAFDFLRDDAGAESDTLPGGDRSTMIGCRIDGVQVDTTDDLARGVRIGTNRGIVSIKDCDFYDIRDEPIYVQTGAHHIAIQNNRFHNCGSNLANTRGMVHCAGTITDLVMSGNTMNGGTAPANAHPLYVVTSSTRVIFEDNNVNGYTNPDPVYGTLTTLFQRGNLGLDLTDVLKVNTDSPVTLTAANNIVRLDATSGAITVNLPAVNTIPTGKSFTLKRKDILSSTNLVTITPNGSDTVGGAPKWQLVPGEFVTIESDGSSNWEVTNRNPVTNSLYYMRKGSSANRRYIAGNQGMYAAVLTSTTSPAANLLWAIPFVVPRTTKFDTISFNVTTGAGSVNARVGIYRDDGNCYPGALVFDSGAIDCTSSGMKDTTITSGLQVFPPGLYWLAWECDTASLQISSIGTTATNICIVGHSSTFGNNSYGYSVAHTFGSLPDPYTGSASVLTAAPTVSNPVPAIGLRPI